jgi:hypothetical protein
MTNHLIGNKWVYALYHYGLVYDQSQIGTIVDDRIKVWITFLSSWSFSFELFFNKLVLQQGVTF